MFKMDAGLYKLYVATTRMIYSDLYNVGIKYDAIKKMLL